MRTLGGGTLSSRRRRREWTRPRIEVRSRPPRSEASYLALLFVLLLPMPRPTPPLPVSSFRSYWFLATYETFGTIATKCRDKRTKKTVSATYDETRFFICSWNLHSSIFEIIRACISFFFLLLHMMREISETCMKVRNLVQLLYAFYVAMRVSKTVVSIRFAFLRTVESAKWDMEEKERKKKIRTLHAGSTREWTKRKFSPFFLVCTRMRPRSFLPSD